MAYSQIFANRWPARGRGGGSSSRRGGGGGCAYEVLDYCFNPREKIFYAVLLRISGIRAAAVAAVAATAEAAATYTKYCFNILFFMLEKKIIFFFLLERC